MTGVAPCGIGGRTALRRGALGALLSVALAVAPETALASSSSPQAPLTRVYSTADADADRDGQHTSAMVWRLWTGTPRVEAVNEAIASARCKRCRAVAVSVQILLVSQLDLTRPDQLWLSNLGLALDAPKGQSESSSPTTVTSCESCSTVALAYQFVVGGDGRTVIRSGARARLAQIRRQMTLLAGSTQSNRQLEAREDALARQIADVLSTGVVRLPAARHHSARPPS